MSAEQHVESVAKRPIRLLIVDDSADDAALLERALRREGMQIVAQRVDSAATMHAALADPVWDAVLCDYFIPGFGGRQALEMLTQSGLDLPFIVVSGTADEATLVEMMRAGAHDIVLKENLKRLAPALDREMKEAETRRRAKLASSALAESESRLRMLARVSPVGIFQIDPHGDCLYVNEQWCTLTGLSAEDARGRGWERAIHPDDRPRVTTLWASADRNRDIAVEFRLVRPDGTMGWVVARAVAERKDPGAIGSYVGTITDVTALREREATLARAEASAHIGNWQYDPRTHDLQVSDEVLRICGRGRHEFDGTMAGLIAWTHPDDRAGFQARMERAHRGEDSPGYERRVVRPDGEVRFVYAQYELDRDANGTAVRVIGYMQDVTERKQAALALERSERHFRKLIERSADAFFIMDASARILYRSPSGKQLTGYDDSDVLGKSFLELAAPESQSAAMQAFKGLLTKPGSSIRLEGKLLRKDTHPVDIEADARNLLDDPDVGGIIVTVRDLTAQHEARTVLEETQAQFRQAQKLEAIGVLTGGVAHDFNNLLSVIMGYSELLLKEVAPGAPTRNELELIHKAGARAAELTRQLLAFSRQQVLEPRVVDLNEIVRDTSKMLGRLLGEDIAVVTQLPEQRAPLFVDPGQIGQVLMNLAVNARDAMPKGGRLTISVTNQDLGEADASARELIAGPHIVLTVTDTGTGMDAATLGRVFEPFFTTKPVGKGTGLGLSTVFGIVRQSGGAIAVESELGKGTTFRIWFPYATQAPETAVSPPDDAALCPGGETILLVEDEEPVRRLVRTMLARAGYTVVDAPSGGDALVLLEKHVGPIDLVITDVVMPLMGGDELARRVHERHPDVRVLFMSGYPDRDGSGDLPTDAKLLRKPFTSDTLLARVREVLREAPHPALQQMVHV